MTNIIDKDKIGEAISVFGDNAQKFTELVLKDSDQYIAEVKTAIDSHDHDALYQSAHALKSILRQLGAHTLGEMALRLEQNGQNKQMDDSADTYQKLANLYQETKNYLTTE